MQLLLRFFSMYFVFVRGEVCLEPCSPTTTSLPLALAIRQENPYVAYTGLYMGYGSWWVGCYDRYNLTYFIPIDL